MKGQVVTQVNVFHVVRQLAGKLQRVHAVHHVLQGQDIPNVHLQAKTKNENKHKERENAHGQLPASAKTDLSILGSNWQVYRWSKLFALSSRGPARSLHRQRHTQHNNIKNTRKETQAQMRGCTNAQTRTHTHTQTHTQTSAHKHTYKGREETVTPLAKGKGENRTQEHTSRGSNTCAADEVSDEDSAAEEGNKRKACTQ